jgi:hypothetical protein
LQQGLGIPIFKVFLDLPLMFLEINH